MADLFDRRTSVDVGGLAVPTLDPADTLAHVALHTVLSGSHRLVWLKDVERLVTRHGQDVVDTAVARSAEWGSELVMADAMGRTQRTVGLPPGTHWARPPTRAARAWLGVAAATDRLSPVERQDGAPSMLRMVSRSVREDAPSSGRVLAGKAWKRATAALRRRPVERALPGTGDGAFTARAEYLAGVVRTTAPGQDGVHAWNDL